MPQWTARPSRPSGRFAMEPSLQASMSALIAGLLFATACGRVGEQAARDVLHAIDRQRYSRNASKRPDAALTRRFISSARQLRRSR